MTKRFIACILLLPCFLLVSCTKLKTLPPELSKDAPITAAPWISGKSAAAFMEASAAQKHFFLYVYAPGKNDAKVKKIFDGSVQKLGTAAQAYTLNIKDASENAIVQKFRLQQAPLPLVLVFAPNGAIMGGFPKERINETTLLNVITTPTFQRCLLALQEGKIVLVCAVKSDASKKGPQVPKGVLDFYNDPQYKDRAKIIAVDPGNAAEKTLLSQLRIDSNAKEATTVILAPPGIDGRDSLRRGQGKGHRQCLDERLCGTRTRRSGWTRRPKRTRRTQQFVRSSSEQSPAEVILRSFKTKSAPVQNGRERFFI